MNYSRGQVTLERGSPRILRPMLRREAQALELTYGQKRQGLLKPSFTIEVEGLDGVVLKWLKTADRICADFSQFNCVSAFDPLPYRD